MTLTIPQALRAAADHIEAHGHHKGKLFSPLHADRTTAPSCGYGALAAVTGMTEVVSDYGVRGNLNAAEREAHQVFNDARLAVDIQIAETTAHPSMPMFNDAWRTTAASVCAKLREAAAQYEAGPLRAKVDERKGSWREWSEQSAMITASMKAVSESMATVTAKFLEWGTATVDVEPTVTYQYVQAPQQANEPAPASLSDFQTILNDMIAQQPAPAPVTKVYNGSKETVDDPSVTEVEVIDAAEELVSAITLETWAAMGLAMDATTASPPSAVSSAVMHASPQFALPA